jgi:16S rRNA (adenine1518-N6/adenine1519-N6)-dimethyltransferase
LRRQSDIHALVQNGYVQVTPSVASDLLERYNLRAGRKHGQHFLVDPNTVRRIVRLAEIHPDETILEIGPGLGSLTVALADAAARVIAIEIDTEVAEALREVIGDLENVELVIGDAMQAPIEVPSRLVANLPYNVATPLIVRILDDLPAVSGGLVMVQRELGERWTASPGSRAYGAVSVHIAYHANARVVGEVPRSVFMPPPNVSSVLVAFDRLERPRVDVPDERGFFVFVRRAFGHRRKTLRNSLGIDEATVTSCGIAPQARPEDVSIAQYASLFAVVGE